jgi:polyhydroxyalkanoate synthesis regulator phasin
LSNIDKPESISLTASKLKKSIVTIQPLKITSAEVRSLLPDEFNNIQKKLNTATYENKDEVLSDARAAYKNADDAQREKIKELTEKVSALSAPVSELDEDELVL